MKVHFKIPNIGAIRIYIAITQIDKISIITFLDMLLTL